MEWHTTDDIEYNVNDLQLLDEDLNFPLPRYASNHLFKCNKYKWGALKEAIGLMWYWIQVTVSAIYDSFAALQKLRNFLYSRI